MKCNFCNNEIPDNAKFCPVCGKPVDNAQNPYQYGTPNQQEPYGQRSDYQQSYGEQPQKKNGTLYLVFAILSIFCCLPLGIIAIIYATKIDALQRVGDYEGAKSAAKKATIFTIISVVLSIIATIFYIVVASLVANTVTDSDDQQIIEQIVREATSGDNAIGVPNSEHNQETKSAVQNKNFRNAWTSYTVQINDGMLTLPCKMEDVKSLGFTLDTNYTPENYMVNANEYELAYFEDANHNTIMAFAYNNTASAMEIKDCSIAGLSVHDYDLENGGLSVIFPGGIQIGATKESVISALGEPSDKYEGDSLHMYTWYDNDSYGKQCEIDFDAKTGLVCEMSLRNM